MKRKVAVLETSGGTGTLDQRVLTLMPLVPLIAEQVCRQVAQPWDRANLAKDGFAGLIEAAHTPQSRVPFGMYVKHRIRGAILDGLLSGAESPRPVLSERRRLPRTPPLRTGKRSVGTRATDRGNEFLQSLFRLGGSLESSEKTGDREKLSGVTANSRAGGENLMLANEETGRASGPSN
jgi:hypothetical protein